MTDIQFRRWYDFAIRMAHRGFISSDGRKLPKKSRELVAHCVKDFFRELISESEWDTRRGEPTVISRIVDWDHTDGSPGNDYYGRPKSAYCMGDVVSLSMEHWNPFYWSRTDHDYDKWDKKWGTRIRCCLRAGLDLASSPSAGVVGFTKKDLFRMYPGGPPEWVTGGDEKWCPWLKKDHDESECQTFEELSDDVGLVL